MILSPSFQPGLVVKLGPHSVSFLAAIEIWQCLHGAKLMFEMSELNCSTKPGLKNVSEVQTCMKYVVEGNTTWWGWIHL